MILRPGTARRVCFVNCRFTWAAMSGLFTRDCAFFELHFSFAALNGSVHIATFVPKLYV